MIQLLRIFSNWITKHTWMQKNRLYKNNHEKCLRRLLTNYDCIECDMANDAWKHWKELVQYVCCLAASGPLKARVASRRRTHHPFEAGSAPTRQPLPERPLDYHDNVTTETVQRLTIAPSHDNLVKRVRINVLIAPIIDQEIGLLLKSVNNILDAIIREVDLLSSRSSLHDVFFCWWMFAKEDRHHCLLRVKQCWVSVEGFGVLGAPGKEERDELTPTRYLP